MLADRYAASLGPSAEPAASDARLSSVFAREFCPVCIGGDGSTQQSSSVFGDASKRSASPASKTWTCPECNGAVDNAEDIICVPCLRALAFWRFVAE